MPPPPQPFVRYPYVQAVSDSSAFIIWTTENPSRDTLVYRVGDGAAMSVVDPVDRRAHSVRLEVPPATPIDYRVHSAAGERTPPHVFTTAPSRGSSDTVRVLIWGDSGWGSESQVDLAAEMEDREFDLALHTGDIAYENGTEFAFTNRHFRVYRLLLARTPLFPSVGNHDVRTDQGRPFDEAFVLPASAHEGVRGVRYYSFDWGQTHFVALDSNEAAPHPDLRGTGAQRQWLACDLASAASDRAIRWIIVYLHHPLYSAASGFASHGSDRDLREALGPIFDRYGVDLVFSGHDHIYERSYPLRGGAIDSVTPGTTYVVTGGGGGTLRWRGASRAWHTAAASPDHHFVELEIATDALSAEVIGRNGDLIDAFRVAAAPAIVRADGDPTIEDPAAACHSPAGR